MMAATIRRKKVALYVVAAYAPTTEASNAEVEAFYAQLTAVIRDKPNKAQLIVLGDFNAKLQCPANEEEAKILGRYGYAPGGLAPMTAQARRNRDSLIELRAEQDLRPMQEAREQANHIPGAGLGGIGPKCPELAVAI